MDQGADDDRDRKPKKKVGFLGGLLRSGSFAFNKGTKVRGALPPPLPIRPVDELRAVVPLPCLFPDSCRHRTTKNTLGA